MRGKVQSEQVIKSEWITVACEKTGLSAEQVSIVIDPIMEHLQQNHAGGRIYWPRRGRVLDIEQIKREFVARVPGKEICRRHAISRTTLHRLIDDAIEEGTLPSAKVKKKDVPN